MEFHTKEGGAVITSTEQNPQMTLSPGIYTIKLTAKNPKASSDKVREDYITVIDKNAIAAVLVHNAGILMPGDILTSWIRH